MRILLVDNGSLRADATRNLRRVAAQLSQHTGEAVHPVSLLHSRKVPAEKLDGVPARVFEPSLREWLENGEREFVVLPFFFGPSLALTDYLPRRVERLQRHWPDLEVRIAPPLVDLTNGGDERIAHILADQVVDALEALHDLDRSLSVAMVDHGSPVPEVTAVRNFVAGQLSVLLNAGSHSRIARVTPCSMERREGDAYRFNEPLLEELLDEPTFSSGPVVVSMLFLSPGRHAGEQGDVATICAAAEARHPELATVRTSLAGEHPLILEVLAERLESVLR